MTVSVWPSPPSVMPARFTVCCPALRTMGAGSLIGSNVGGVFTRTVKVRTATCDPLSVTVTVTTALPD